MAMYSFPISPSTRGEIIWWSFFNNLLYFSLFDYFLSFWDYVQFFFLKSNLPSLDLNILIFASLRTNANFLNYTHRLGSSHFPYSRDMWLPRFKCVGILSQSTTLNSFSKLQVGNFSLWASRQIHNSEFQGFSLPCAFPFKGLRVNGSNAE